jgi:hypothetical protein
MSTLSVLKRLIGLGTWIALVAITLTFLLRWRGSATSQKVVSSEPTSLDRC